MRLLLRVNHKTINYIVIWMTGYRNEELIEDRYKKRVAEPIKIQPPFFDD